MNKSVRFLLIVILLIFQSTVYGSEINSELWIQSHTDSSSISLRIPGNDFLNKYLADKSFNYKNALKAKENLGIWMKLWRFLIELLTKIKGLFNLIPFILVIFLTGAVILFLLMLITKTKIYRIFYNRKALEQIPYFEEVSESAGIDIDLQIETEVQNRSYRKAIRLMFIKLLHLLDTKQYIVLSKGKTNTDFESELKGTALADGFRQSAIAFEYVWYGNINLDSILFTRITDSFKSLFTQLDD